LRTPRAGALLQVVSQLNTFIAAPTTLDGSICTSVLVSTPNMFVLNIVCVCRSFEKSRNKVVYLAQGVKAVTIAALETRLYINAKVLGIFFYLLRCCNLWRETDLDGG